ncbi:MAG: glycosyltransferase family 2 protein [Desulfobacteraceae bacterium]|nr:glycosyltransferase family 2 protein [Desulfobacteraceae bacterium]
MQDIEYSLHSDLMDNREAGKNPPERDHKIGVSVICPFYNEAQIIEDAVNILLAKMSELDVSWELIVVNDGSVDESEKIVSKLCEKNPKLRQLSYPFNQGRGYALRIGIAAARGDIIITTEIDLSWGDDIVNRLFNAMLENPDADIIVASPHLKGGGYKNVPPKRVFLSKFGNKIIRTFMTNAATMNTGMTRAYKREVIQTIPLEEKRKEFHLEIIMKAQALGYRIIEIPCVLEWKAYKHKGKRVKRKSSSKVNKLVLTHSLFSLFANPIRYVWGISLISMLISVGFFIWSVFRLHYGLVSVFTVIVCLSLLIISIILFGFGVLAQQNNMVQRELWTLKQEMQKQKLAKEKK